MNSLSKDSTLNRRMVLLLDPDNRMRSWVAIRLESMDLRVLEAVTAEEALEVMKSEEPHLVVADWPLAGDSSAEPLFQKLSREKKPLILFSQEVRTGEGRWHVPRHDREKLVEKVAGFLNKAPQGPVSTAPARQILIIEDSPTLRGILRRALEKGFPGDVVREAEDGRKALLEMSSKKVDLIITDLEMPGMDGHTFIHHLKNNPLLSKKPVLVFSSNITAELREQVKQMPKVRLLSKPAEPEKIIQEVTILLREEP